MRCRTEILQKRREKIAENNSEKEGEIFPNRKVRIFLIVIQTVNGFWNTTNLIILLEITKLKPIE